MQFLHAICSREWGNFLRYERTDSCIIENSRHACIVVNFVQNRYLTAAFRIQTLKDVAVEPTCKCFAEKCCKCFVRLVN